MPQSAPTDPRKLHTTVTYQGENESDPRWQAWSQTVVAWAMSQDMQLLLDISQRLHSTTSVPVGAAAAPSASISAEFVKLESPDKAKATYNLRSQTSQPPSSEKLQSASLNIGDFDEDELTKALSGKDFTPAHPNLQTHMKVLRTTILAAKLGKQWNDCDTQNADDEEELEEMHAQVVSKKLREMNLIFIGELRTNLFGAGIAPKCRDHGNQLQLIRPAFYNTEIDWLMTNDPRLLCSTWQKKPWLMPAVKAWLAVLRLATSVQSSGCNSLLQDLGSIITASADTNGLTAHELDAKANLVLQVLDRFTTVGEVQDLLRVSVRVESMKAMASRTDSVGLAYTEANKWMIGQRHAGHPLTIASTDYALGLAASFLADAKYTSTPAKAYAAAVGVSPTSSAASAADTLATQEGFTTAENTAYNAGIEYERGRNGGGRGDGGGDRGGRGGHSKRGGRGGNKSRDDRDHGERGGRSTDRRGGGGDRGDRRGGGGDRGGRDKRDATPANRKQHTCNEEGCPTPTTHGVFNCPHRAAKLIAKEDDRARGKEHQAYCSSLASNKHGDDADPSYYSCLDSDLHSPPSCVPPSTSTFWSNFVPKNAPSSISLKLDCKETTSAVLDSGASVDITSERHRCTGAFAAKPETVQGISGTTDAWPTKIQWLTKTDDGTPHIIQTSGGFENFKQLFMPDAPAQLLSLSQLVEMGYKPHLNPSRTRSWLETPGRKRITVPLIDGVWKLPLWQETDKPQVIPSRAAPGGGVLRAPRTFSATSKRLSFWNLEAEDSVESDASHFSGERDTEPCTAGPLVDNCRERTNNTNRSTTGADFSPSGESDAHSCRSGERLAPHDTCRERIQGTVSSTASHTIESSDSGECDLPHLHLAAALYTSLARPGDAHTTTGNTNSTNHTAYMSRLATENAVLRPARHLRYQQQRAAADQTYSMPSPQQRRSRLARTKQDAGRNWQYFAAGVNKRANKHSAVLTQLIDQHLLPSSLATKCGSDACTRCSYVVPAGLAAATCQPCAPTDSCFMAAGSTQAAYNQRPLSAAEEEQMQVLHDKWCHPSNSKFLQIYKSRNGIGFPNNFKALLSRFRCRVCALCKGARRYRRSTRMQVKGSHQELPFALKPGDVVLVGDNDTPTIGIIEAALTGNNFVVLVPGKPLTTYPSSQLFLAEENSQDEDIQQNVPALHADPSLDEERLSVEISAAAMTNVQECAAAPVTTQQAPVPGAPPARNLSIDFAHTMSVGWSKEEYYLVIHTDGIELAWCAPTVSRSQPHELIQEFLDVAGVSVRSIRFDNAMEFGKSDRFRSWAKAKGAILCPTVDYNHTLNSKSESYVRITKEHLRCMLRSSHAPRRLWPFAIQHFCRIFGWWPKANGGAAPWTRVGNECQIPANLDRDLHAFGCYCVGHLPRESPLVENSALDDRGLEGAFLMCDRTTPTFWMWSFKFNKPVKMCDGVFYDSKYPFRDPSVLQHPGCLSAEEVRAMHDTDGILDSDDTVAPHYDLRSHAVPAPSLAPADTVPSALATPGTHGALIHASNVIGDISAPQIQTRARINPEPPVAVPFPTQISAAPQHLTRKDYHGWTLGMHVPAHAEIELLSDLQLAKALVHQQYMFELPAGYFQHPDTQDATQAVTVVSKAIQKCKGGKGGFIYLILDIVGPPELMQDNLGELHVPIRSGKTARTNHSYTIRDHLAAAFDRPQTLADIGISKQAHSVHLAALRTAWMVTRRAAITQRVQLAAAKLAAARIEQLPTSTPPTFFKQVLPVHPPTPHTLPFGDAARNKVWLAAVSDSKVDANLLASIDMLQPDPAHRGAAMASNFRPFWLTAEQEEWAGLWQRKCFKVWKRADLARNDRIFTSRYVYKLKRDAITGKVSRFKARLIVQGFKMQQDVDYNDTFSPTPGSTATRVVVSIATAEDMELHSVDFTQAFIQADRLPEGVNGRFFVTPPPGSPHANQTGIVYEVLRPLYGVPSSPRALHKTLDSYFKSEGFVNVGFEESVWRRNADAKYTADIVVSCHVDDSLIACPSLAVIKKFKQALLTRFAGTDEGPVTQYLGCQLIRDRKNCTSKFVQTAYTERLLRTFDMWDNVKTVATPMEPGTRLVKADCPESPDPVLQRRYRGIVGSIGFLVQMTRCDLAFAYGQLSQFLHCPGPVHLLAAERALAYVRGTSDFGLYYSDLGAGRRNVLTGWVDSDFASDSDTRRSVTGYVMSLNGAPISWRSCRQGGVTLSSSEAEYVAASAVAQENAYLRSLLTGFDRAPVGPTCVWEDNAACILMSENPVNRDRSRHVDVKFHFLRERVRAGEIKLYKCWGPLNVADALTKSLPRVAFQKHMPYMTGTPCPYQPFASALTRAAGG